MNDDEATLLALVTGHLQSAMHLLHPALTEYVKHIPQSAPNNEELTGAKVNKKKSKRKKKKETDFSILLKKIRCKCDDGTLVNPGLSGIVDRCLQIRNFVSHQKLPLYDCERQIETMIQLAVAIERFDIVKKIRDLVGHTLFSRNQQVPQVQIPVSPRNDVSAHPLGTKDSTAENASISSDNECWQELKEKGNTDFRNKNYTKAMILYSRAIFLDPNQAILYSNRAVCELRLGKFQHAREDAEDAIKLDNDKVKYYRILSEALFNLGYLAECNAVCLRGLNLDARDPTLLIRRRDCVAHISTQETDEISGTPKEASPEILESILPSWLDKYECSKPKPSDIKVVSSPEVLLKVLRLSMICKEAHEHQHGWNGKSIDERTAASIFESAAKDGSAEGWYNLAYFHIRGLGGRAHDFKRAHEYLVKAASQKAYYYYSSNNKLLPNTGVAEAENSLGNCYRDGRGVDEDPKEAFKWYLKSSEHGCREGQNNLGLALQNGHGVKEDMNSARIWFQRAAAEGLAEAQINYAEMLEKGLGGPVNVREAYDVYKKAAAQGFPDAFQRLQRIIRNGSLGASFMLDTTLETDSSTVGTFSSLLSKAVNQKDSNAFFLHGINSYAGEGGVSKNLSRAEVYLKKAAQLGHVQAKAVLAELLVEEKRRSREGFEYMLQAAEDGVEKAQYKVGLMYAYGHGCPRDEGRARRWLERSNLQEVRLSNPTADADFSAANIIEEGKQVCNFELQSRVSSDGMTIGERYQRFCKSALNCDKLDGIFHLLSLPPPNPLSESIRGDVTDWLPEMIQRAEQGSQTARSYITAAVMIYKAKGHVLTGCIERALALVKESYRHWDIYYYDEVDPVLLAAAQTQLDKNPNDADAMFYIAINYNRRGSFAEAVGFLEQCIEKKPRDADFHWLLSCHYGFENKFEESLHAVDRALELDPRPQWLYTRATSLRLSQMDGDDFIGNASTIITAYQRFLHLNAPDERKVPEAHYCIGMMFLLKNQNEEALLHWRKGQEAEDPAVRLPGVKPVGDDFPPKVILRDLLTLSSLQASDGSPSPKTMT